MAATGSKRALDSPDGSPFEVVTSKLPSSRSPSTNRSTAIDPDRAHPPKLSGILLASRSLQRIRHAYGLRVVDIAAAAGVSIDTVRRIDRTDVAALQLRSLVKVAQALGLIPTDLVPRLARPASGGGLIARQERLRSQARARHTIRCARHGWRQRQPRMTERALRGVGRKNHYGSRSERGTRVAALFYSLIESAKLAGVEPRAYLGEAARRAIRSPGTVTLSRDFD